MARELVDLNLARAIPPLSHRGIYILSPLAPMHSITTQSHTFAQKFPSAPSLLVLLSSISRKEPQRWNAITSHHQCLPTDILPWLIRHGWLTQLRQFYFIRIPRSISHLAEDIILQDPYRASREQARWIHTLAEDVGGTKARVFERLGKYFDGKSARDKILRREEVERRELDEVVLAFRQAGGIVVAEHW